MSKIQNQLSVDIKDQLTLAQASCKHQLMVETQEIRDAFVSRLNQALDGKEAVRKGRGRNVDFYEGVRTQPAFSASKQATHKWLKAESMPGRANMLAIAEWLGVRVEWLQYGEGEPHLAASESDQPSPVNDASQAKTPASPSSSAAELVRAMLATKAGKALSQAAQERLLAAVDEPQSPAIVTSNIIPADFSRLASLVEGDILIPQYDVRASMGHGQMPAEYAEFVRNVVVSGPQLEKLGLEFTSPANLSIITGWGQSMEGTINDKDPVIVDRGVNEFAGDGIYVLTWNDMLYIKRLQMADANHFELISDNQKHKDRTVPISDVTIHARVLYVWNGKKL